MANENKILQKKPCPIVYQLTFNCSDTGLYVLSDYLKSFANVHDFIPIINYSFSFYSISMYFV